MDAQRQEIGHESGENVARCIHIIVEYLDVYRNSIGQSVKVFVVSWRWAETNSNEMRPKRRLDFDRLSVISEKVVVDNWMCREQMNRVSHA